MLNTYLNFDGNCREAFDFYRSVFGGEFMILQTFGDAPSEYQPPEGEQDKVMHVSFPIGDNILMGSDIPSNMGLTLVSGNNFSISVSPESRERAESLFKRAVRWRHGYDADAGYVLGIVLRLLRRQVRRQLAGEFRGGAVLALHKR